MQTGHPPRFQPRVEGLEDRTLMATALTASLAGGVLRIEGTNRSDHIVVRQSAHRISVDNTPIHVSGQGRKTNVHASDVTKIVVRGLDGNDTIVIGGSATTGPNALRTPTTVRGGNGNDTIIGGQGKDSLHGEAGNDRLHGRGGNDYLNGGSGNDQLRGGAGDDRLYAGAGNDLLRGDSGNDRLYGNEGNDRLFGGAGKDRLDGGSGANHLDGDSGNDALFSRSRRDTLDGGSGNDVANFYDGAAPRSTRGVPASLIRNVETFRHPGTTRTQAAAEAVPFQSEVNQLIRLTNAYRASRGLPTLTVDARLTEAARYQAEYMARTGHYSHVNRDGRDLTDRVRAAGYSYSFVGENIHLYDPAIRRTHGVERTYQRSELARYYLDGWKASAGHDRNLLSSLPRHIGIAMAVGRSGRIYVAQVFGRP